MARFSERTQADRDAFAAEMRLFREDLGISANHMARDLGINRTTISRLEHGNRFPSLSLVRRLATLATPERAVYLYLAASMIPPDQATAALLARKLLEAA